MTDNEAVTDTRQCPFCLAEVPRTATRCRHCAADYPAPVSAPDLGGFWAGGILLALVGVGLLAAGEDVAWLGAIVLGVGGTLLQIAVIATAVSIGTRDRDRRTYRNRLDAVTKLTADA